MKNNQPNVDDLIFQYLDGQLPMQDKERFEVELKVNADLRTRFTELKLIHDKLAHAVLESPSSNFTARVMINLGTFATPTMLSPKNGLILLLGVGIATLLGVYFLSSGLFDQLTGPIALEQFSLPKTIIKQPLPSIPFNGNLVMKVLVGLDLAIAFVLFDRTILQPYFRNRARRA
jgi:anti-sigma factor RsiW